jgi:hypothetical protein
MAAANVTWGEERIANELKLQLGIRVSPRTVGKYLRTGRPVRTPDPKQRWLSFVRNHARIIVASDFFAVITATFRMLYVFVIMDLGTRRILHHNATAHPTAEWTAQQFREALSDSHVYRFVIHDRDNIYTRELDRNYAPWECTCCEHRCAHQRRIRLRALRRDATSRMPGLSHSVQ